MKGVIRSAAVAASLSLLLAACGEDADRAAFTLDFAPATCGAASGTVPDCVHIRVCEPGALDAPSEHECFPLVAVDGDHDKGSVDGFGMDVGADGRVEFDGKLKGNRFDVEVVGYGAEGEIIALGRARNVALAKGTKVRVYPVGASSCASDDTPDERALHTSLVLPNGDVLILGGVRGTGVGGEKSANFQPSIEVFHTNSGQFETVDAEPFSRVFFAATASARDTDPPYRIFVTGGFSPSETTAAAVRVNPDGDDVLQAPVAPLAGLDEPGPALLVYDPSKNSVTVTEQDPLAAENTGGWTVTPSTRGEATERKGAFYALTGDGTCWASSAANPCGARTWQWFIDAVDDVSASEIAASFRASPARIAPGAATLGNRVVLWGGPIARTQLTREANAGASISTEPGEESMPLVAVPGAEVPAFETLTPFGTDTVLALGGVTTDCLEGCMFNHILSNTYVAAPVQVGKFASTTSVTWTATALAPYAPSILHTVTPLTLPNVAQGEAALIVGGTDEASPGVLGYGARDQVVLVRYDGATFAVDDLGGRVPAQLAQARWGHTAVLLSDGRVFVHGGFAPPAATSGATNVDAIAAPEILSLGVPGAPASACSVTPGG